MKYTKILGLALAFGFGFASFSPVQADEPVKVEVVLKDNAFLPKEIKVPAGKDIMEHINS